MKANEYSAKAWNQKFPVGTECHVRKDNGSVMETRTRSEAFKNSAGIDVIFLEGISGYYLLSRVNPRRDMLN